MTAEQRSRGALIGEVALVVVLLVAWVLAWLANNGSLDSYSPAGRSLFLNNWFTVETLGPSLVLGTVAIAVLPLRHKSPLAALFVIGAAVLALEWFYPFVVSFSVTFALKIAVFWVAWKVRQWWIVMAVIVPVIVALSVRQFQVNQRFEELSFQLDADASSTSNVISVSAILEEQLFFAVVVVGGLIARRFVQQRSELEERNQELEVERARASQAAVNNERLRISRELHDVVAHHVTTMTVHAGASRQLITSNPEAATDSLRQIESAGREAVNELHQLLGFLRNSDGDEGSLDRSPTPSLRHLAELQKAAGSPIECNVVVDGDLSTVPAAVDVSAYRIIQEAFTNTMKHSDAEKVAVHVTVDDQELSLSVCDEGPAKPAPISPSGGHGLVGMRERATLHGGHVDVGLAEDGKTWRVEATLPFGGSK